MINRPKYLDLLIKAKDIEHVKIIVGVRRCGKSTLLKMMQQHLISVGVNQTQIITINFQDFDNEHLKDGAKFHTYVKSLIVNEQKYYLFVDEIQEMEEWAKYINSLNETCNIDIYVTGSNSRIWIGEHLTYLGGRYVAIDMYPLSINEYSVFINEDYPTQDTYDEFIKGSFPGYVLAKDPDNKRLIMQHLYSSIFHRDIMLRNKFPNEALFERVAKFLFENIGKQTSIKSIYDTLQSSGIKVGQNTIDAYIKAMIDAYVLYPCQRYDIRGKELLKTNAKFYIVDFGLRNYLLPQANTNAGSIYENFIYLELLKQGFKVTTGKIGKDLEIDFIAKKNETTLYIQVAKTVEHPDTFNREIKPFSLFETKHKKILVTEDRFTQSSETFDHLRTFDFIKLISKI